MDRYELVVRVAQHLRTLRAPGWFEAQKQINHLAMFGSTADLEEMLPKAVPLKTPIERADVNFTIH